MNLFSKKIRYLLGLFILFSIVFCGCQARYVAQIPTQTATETQVATSINLPSPTLISSPTPMPLIPSPSQIIDDKINVPILYYHSITDNVFGITELHVSPSDFDMQMAYLKENNYDVITFEQLKDANRFQKPILISFDDGYENNYVEAYPILKKYNFKATIFLCTSLVNTKTMLKEEQIKNMTDIFNFQSHIVSHDDMTKMSPNTLKKQLTESKEYIENLTGSKVIALAYPTGYYNNKVIDEVKNYYEYAVTNKGGRYYGSNNYEIKRIYIPRNMNIKNFISKIK